MNNKLEVIGIDHGWSMMKTIFQVFVTGVTKAVLAPMKAVKKMLVSMKLHLDASIAASFSFWNFLFLFMRTTNTCLPA